ncbi:MAG TPA: glutamine ABC transporter substrate-binding protein [Eubacteriaceae bacterium]|nr:glutamine ABC transporter substrate-binding protein [Eubacteriaceae bacterium]
MKKQMILVLIVLMSFALVVGCSGGDEEADVVYDIATDTTFAPFEFQDDNGDYVGIDIDLLAAIAEDQGFEYELNPLGFNAAVAALESGQTDAVIAGMSITDERKEKYDFSEPYYDSGVVMAIDADNEEVSSYEDLEGKKVAVKVGTEGATFAESISEEYGFELTYFEESPMMYEDVKTGNAAACFEDYPVMGYGIAQGNGLKMVTDMEKGSSYGFAVLQGENQELLEMFDAGLENIRENGTYQEIIDKYISAE